MKHNFKALQTFRGWSKSLGCWRYGFFWQDYSSYNKDYLIDVDVVEKESIGIYTGKDDKYGTPIFAGLPEDVNIGGDALYDDGLFLGYARYDDGKSIFGGSFYLADEEGYSTHEAFEDEYESCEWHVSVEVSGTQYEQHVKDTQ